MTTVTIILTLCILHQVRGQTPQQVKGLVDSLMTNYDKRIRPVADQSLPVILDVSLNLISIIGTDEVNEKLETSGYLTIQWDDSLLTWDPSLNDEVYRIFLPQVCETFKRTYLLFSFQIKQCFRTWKHSVIHLKRVIFK